MNDVCILTPFSHLPQYIVEGNEVCRLSDGTEALFDGMINALSIILDTLIICPL